MRKLKLQVQMSIDGYVAGPNGELDWMVWDWDDQLKSCVNQLHTTVGTILLGRKMTDGFVSHWESVLTKPDDPAYAFAKIMVDTPKVVFSKTLAKSTWKNTALAKGTSRRKWMHSKDRAAERISSFTAGPVSSRRSSRRISLMNTICSSIPWLLAKA